LIPPRLFMFGAVGATGVVVHMAALTFYFKGFSMYFPYAQATATLTAMTTNFLINNWLTYQDKRLRGTRLLTGWLSFCGLCTIGAVANVGIATYIYELPFNWGIAGIAGILISVVWNYAATSLLTWRS